MRTQTFPKLALSSVVGVLVTLGSTHGSYAQPPAVGKPAKPSPVGAPTKQMPVDRLRPDMDIKPIRKDPKSGITRVGTSFFIGELGTPTARLEFGIPRPGKYEVIAQWTGKASCTLTVRGPGGFHAETSGSGPLTLSFDAVSNQARAKEPWIAEVATTTGGSAKGELSVLIPGPTDSPPTGGKGSGDSASCSVKRTILDNGSVEVTYPDGTVATYSMGGCGFSIRNPDGTVMRAICQQLPSTDPPPPPTDGILEAWLGALETDLLDQIGNVLDDETAVTRYRTAEARSSPTVYKRIELRLSALDRLLQAMITMGLAASEGP